MPVCGHSMAGLIQFLNGGLPWVLRVPRYFYLTNDLGAIRRTI